MPKLILSFSFLLSISLLSSIALLSGCGQKEASTESQEKQPAAKPVAAPAPINPAVTGTVAGVVKFEGTPPKAESIDMSGDPACTMGTPPYFSEAYAVKGGKLANVFV